MNLYTRLTMCCFAVGAATAAAIFVIEHRNTIPRVALQNESRELGESVAAALGKAAQLDLRAGEKTSLQKLAEESVRPGTIRGVRFLSADGSTLAMAGRVADIAPTGLVVTVPVTDEGIAWRASDQKAQTIGSVELSMMAPSVPAATAPVGEQIAYVLAGVFAVAATMATLFIRNAFAPLRKMVDAVRKISMGELDTMLPASNVPLFQGVASAINSLTQRIRDDQKLYQSAERDLQKTIEVLEKKLAARTAQLEAANGRLCGEIAEKEDFLRAVSHDLNAPLRNIGGMVTMLLTKNKVELTEDALGRLDRIKKNVDIETDLINELLELSRIKSKQRTLALVETESLLWDLRGMFESDLKTRGIELIVDTSLPPLYGEKSRVRQVFQNLIDNAIKYMGDRPTREIHVGCNVNLAEAEFYVRDSGMGIHPEDVQKVFYVFRRGRGEVTHKIPGKGVGLASVKAIVETYSGQIWVESQLDVGATFRFTINGKFVPAVSGQVPDELQGKSIPTPTLAPKAA